MNYLDTPYLKFIFKYINTLGLNPLNRNIYTTFLGCLNYCIVCLVFIANIYDVIVFNVGGVETLEKITLMAYMLITNLKCIWWLIKQKKVLAVLCAINSMWPLNKFGIESVERHMKVHNIAFLFAKSYSLFFYATSLSFMMLGLYEKELVIPGYYGCNLANPTCFYALSLFQSAVIFCSLLIPELGFDMFYLAMVTFISITADQIKIGLERWSTSAENLNTSKQDIEKFLHEIITQHSHLLQFVGMLQELYFEIFLAQVIAATYNLVFSLYLLTYEGIPSLMDIVLYTMLYGTYSIQIAFICKGGEIISNQTESIGEAAYATNWYSNNNKLSKALSMIIIKAQIPEKIRAAGLIDIDLITFQKIINSSFKICALIKTVTEVTK